MLTSIWDIKDEQVLHIITFQNTFISKQAVPARKIKRVEEDPNDKDDEMWNYYDVCKHYWIMDGWLRMEPCLRHKCTLLKMPKVSPKYSKYVHYSKHFCR